MSLVSDSYTEADIIYSWLNPDSLRVDERLQIPQYTLEAWYQVLHHSEYSTGNSLPLRSHCFAATYERQRATRSSTSMPALAHSTPNTLERSFLHTAIRIWNTLTETIVGEISTDRVQTFNSHVHEYPLSLAFPETLH